MAAAIAVLPAAALAETSVPAATPTPSAPVAVPALPSATPTAPVTIEVANVRNTQGTIRLAICPRGQFLHENCPLHAEAPARAGVTFVTIANVPPGDYAAQAFHDENNNGRVDRALFGIPKEGVGFSRDARIVLGPPKWADAVFTHGAVPQTLRFALRYFLGPASPAGWASAHPRRP